MASMYLPWFLFPQPVQPLRSILWSASLSFITLLVVRLRLTADCLLTHSMAPAAPRLCGRFFSAALRRAGAAPPDRVALPSRQAGWGPRAGPPARRRSRAQGSADTA